MRSMHGWIFFALIATALPLPLAQAAGLDDAYERLFRVQLAIAEKGDPKGMYHLGEMYENGLGTPEDRQKAIEWYKRAAKGGNPLAQRRLQEQESEMQLARAHDETEKAAEAARRRAQQESERAARAAAEAKQRKSDQEAVRTAKAAEAARLKAEEDVRAATARLHKAEAERRAAAEREAKRKAAFRRAWEAAVKQAKAAENVIQ